MDYEYGRMFERLINERNELRKYIIDICELLDIDTGQSLLGANCLEFYAVLCSTAENKIKDLQEQLKRKEEELQAQIKFTAHEQKLIYCVAYDETCKTGNDCKQEKCIFKDNIKLKQTLTEIKPILEFYANSNMGEEQPDKTYHIMLNGSYIMVYDPKPARQALQKISECEVKNE